MKLQYYTCLCADNKLCVVIAGRLHELWKKIISQVRPTNPIQYDGQVSTSSHWYWRWMLSNVYDIISTVGKRYNHYHLHPGKAVPENHICTEQEQA